MFDIEVLIFELRAVDGEGTGPVIPEKITALNHELGYPTESFRSDSTGQEIDVHSVEAAHRINTTINEHSC